jgi:hypothetical protein
MTAPIEGSPIMARNIRFLIVLASVVTASCGSPEKETQSLATTPALAAPPGLAEAPGTRNDMASVIYLAAQTLGDRAEGLAKGRPIIVTTIVSVDDLNSSSTFGRLAATLVADRIAQRGYLVRDVTYMRALSLEPKTGELVLSREASRVSASIHAQAVVAGTYAVAGKEIYLNLRLLSAQSGELLSSADVVIPLDDNTRPLVDAAEKDRLASANGLMAFDQFEAGH